MENFTDDKNGVLSSVLSFIGLDLDNIPQFLKEYENIEYSVLRGYDDKIYKVYKYIPISKIQILLTDVAREEDLKNRYNQSSPLIDYITPAEDTDIEKQYTFFKIIENLNEEDIEKTSIEQENFNNNVPFRVKFKENYLWQIYYSESTDQYFMLVPTKNFNTSKMLYLLKEQLKNSEGYIYAPITCLDYTEEMLSKLEILDLENYLMNFTGNWPQIYEVFDKEDNCKIYISGEANIYEGIVVKYRVILGNKEKALEFFKLTKALFIMQNEMYSKYKFSTRLNADNELDFWYGNVKITYEYLPKFISEEYNMILEKILKSEDELVELNEKLQNLKIVCFKKEKEYFYKEKEISIYLKYRKTFLGKIRYYFKSKKKKNHEVLEELSKEQESDVKSEISRNTSYVNFYTLDELKAIDSTLGQKEKQVNMLKSDIKSIEIKIANLDKKIENAKIYIEEIDKNTTSIFDFWKFTNKDTVGLPEGREQNKEDANFKLQKVFSFVDNFEELSKNMDALLRTEFTLEELDAIFVLKECNIIFKDINLIKDGKEDLQGSLDELKEKIREEENKLGQRNFDIFGNVMENQSAVKVLGGEKHRETKKSIYKILNINENTTLEEYKIKLQEYIEKIENIINKVNINYDITLYKSYNSYDDFKTTGYEFYSLDINEVLGASKKILIRLDIKNYLNAVPCTNIVFYTDTNKTLPVGMNCSKELLVNNNNLNFEMLNKKEIVINNYEAKDIDCDTVEVDTIDVYEYMVKNK